MVWKVIRGLAIPFFGTLIGAAGVFLLAKNGDAAGRRRGYRWMIAFAAGVMMAASVWSLLIPATEEAVAAGMGRLSFLPAVLGFSCGSLLFLLLEGQTARLRVKSAAGEPRKTSLLILAVILHNIPEGIAIGIVYAGLLAGEGVTSAAALALSVGIAIQNIPDGAIISLPLAAEGVRRPRAFWIGLLSGTVEPLAALITLAGAGLILPAMPFLLSFAAGAMVYVVVDDLFPEISADGGSAPGTLLFLLGFALMMVLDLALN